MSLTGEEKLKKLREAMTSRGYDAYIILHSDEHDVKYNKIKKE